MYGTSALTLAHWVAQETWYEMGSATPEDPLRKFGYSNLNIVPLEDSERFHVGLTYETEAEGCE